MAEQSQLRLGEFWSLSGTWFIFHHFSPSGYRHLGSVEWTDEWAQNEGAHFDIAVKELVIQNNFALKVRHPFL